MRPADFYSDRIARTPASVQAMSLLQDFAIVIDGAPQGLTVAEFDHRALHDLAGGSMQPAPASSGMTPASRAARGADTLHPNALQACVVFLGIDELDGADLLPALLAGQQLQTDGQIDRILLPAIRSALAAVPARLRDQIAMPVDLWHLLTESARELLKPAGPAGVDQAQPINDDDQVPGQFMYSIACGEALVNG